MSRPKLLDLFCCQGGASEGYASAGFVVDGVDIDPQPRYPYPFTQADAVTYLQGLISSGEVHRYAAIHASPPCQAHSNAQKIQKREHPDFIVPIRELLIESGLPYVIENVPGAPLMDPAELCGAMFGLRTYRHRLFETNWDLRTPEHPEHQAPTVKMGRKLKEGDYYHAVGNFSNVEYVRKDLGVEWMNRDGIRESIPPDYSEWVGRQLLLSETVSQSVSRKTFGKAA